MGIKLHTFYCCAAKPPKRWTICKYKRRPKPKPTKPTLPAFTAAAFEKVAALPDTVRVSVIANALGITADRVCGFCDKYNVPIILAGRRPIKIISRDKFIEEVMNHEGET